MARFMSATMRSTAPQPAQPAQPPELDELSPQWSRQSHRPRVAMRCTANAASTAIMSATTTVEGVQTNAVISPPPSHIFRPEPPEAHSRNVSRETFQRRDSIPEARTARRSDRPPRREPRGENRAAPVRSQSYFTPLPLPTQAFRRPSSKACRSSAWGGTAGRGSPPQ